MLKELLFLQDSIQCDQNVVIKKSLFLQDSILCDRNVVIKESLFLQDSIQCDRNVVIKALHASSSYFDVGCHEARTLRQLLIADPHGFSHTVRLLVRAVCMHELP